VPYSIETIAAEKYEIYTWRYHLSLIKTILSDHRNAADTIGALEPEILRAGSLCIQTLKTGGKILICGNGGSAADAQHFSAEIVGRFVKERRGYPAIALATDSSILTSVGNDYSFENIYARQVEAYAKPGDLLFGISTSGNSGNIVRAMTAAKKAGIATIALLGNEGGSIKNMCDVSLVVPVAVTARIQECHILIIHMICALIDEELA
jgi:D-sedoheptulose 7-phosphate isomerase